MNDLKVLALLGHPFLVDIGLLGPALFCSGLCLFVDPVIQTCAIPIDVSLSYLIHM